MPRSLFTPAYGELVRAMIEARRLAGMRQADLAVRLGKPQSFISKVETGERRLDVIEFLVVCRAMEVDPVDLLSDVVSRIPEGTTI